MEDKNKMLPLMLGLAAMSMSTPEHRHELKAPRKTRPDKKLRCKRMVEKESRRKNR